MARLAFAMMVCLGVTEPAQEASRSASSSLSRTVLAFFEGHATETIDAFLAGIRPAPLDGESRARLLQGLPRAGEVRPAPKDRNKIIAAEHLLDFSARRGCIEIRVIDVDEAFVGLYERTVVLVSARALGVLSTDQLSALVAHELGHDYDWDAYASALATDDVARLQALELKSDAVAVLLLLQAGIDPEQLVSAVRAMIRYNDWRSRMAGATPREEARARGERYLSLSQRVAFIRDVARLPWAGRPEPSASRSLAPKP